MTKAVAIAPVIDLRREPVKAGDSFQESQLLYGERVEVIEERGQWCWIAALEQKKFLEGKWVHYPGWVEAKDLVFLEEFPETNEMVSTLWADIVLESGQTFSVTAGTRLKIEGETLFLPDGRQGRIDSTALLRPSSIDELVSMSKKRLGHPYLWGGRSAYHPEKLRTGCDCSGLVNLAYRLYGIDLPRDAHDQYLFCEPIEELEMGDLVFLFSEKKPDRVDHVMLYAGEGQLLEATAKTGNVRMVTVDERLADAHFTCGRPLTSKGENG